MDMTGQATLVEGPRPGLARAATLVYVALAWALVGSIVLQVFFIGLGLFVDSANLQLHRDFGWILHVAPLLVLVAAAAAGAGRGRIALAGLMVVVVWLVPILAAVRSEMRLAAAFHPVFALAAFALAVLVARGATSLWMRPETDRTTVREWLVVALVVVVVLFLSFSGSPEPT